MKYVAVYNTELTDRQTDGQTDTQNDYRNPTAHAPRVNNERRYIPETRFQLRKFPEYKGKKKENQ